MHKSDNDGTIVNSDGIVEAIDTLTTGRPIACELKLIQSDTLAKPVVILATAPFVDSANQNVHRISPPDIKLVNTDLPHFIPEMVPHRFQRKKLQKELKSTIAYTAPVPGLAPNFKDAASYNVQYLDVDQGLSSSYVMNIVEDSRGNLWFANWTSGVSMYDGKSFVHFVEQNGLLSNYIWTIHEDSKGNMWFGSDGFGVGKYDGSVFTNYDEVDGLGNNLVLDIDEDADGNLWFATAGGIQ
ncbi:MAG: hypothetical protein IPO32_13665 [Crocinitomicaceae bacterium]|nr:hypothetical protein [Crocinitomicaceae bacterium]